MRNDEEFDFNQVAANLAAGFFVDAETLRRFVAEAVKLKAENERLTAELDELRAGLDRMLDKLRDDELAEVVRVTGHSDWPGE